MSGTAYSSSSFLTEGDTLYSAELAFDNDLTTAWCEGGDGSGEGEWIEINFSESMEIDGLIIYPGFHRSENLFHFNGKPLSLNLVFDGEESVRYSLSLDIPYEFQHEDYRGPGGAENLGWSEVLLNESPLYLAPRFLLFPHQKSVRTLRVEMEYICPGFKWNDTLISEIMIIRRDGEDNIFSSLTNYLIDMRDDELTGAEVYDSIPDLDKTAKQPSPRWDSHTLVDMNRPKEYSIADSENRFVAFWEIFREHFVGKAIILSSAGDTLIALGESYPFYFGFGDDFQYNYIGAYPFIKTGEKQNSSYILNEAYLYGYRQ